MELFEAIKQEKIDLVKHLVENGAGVNDDSIYHGNIYYNNAFKSTI